MIGLNPIYLTVISMHPWTVTLPAMYHGIPQGSVLGRLLFLLYIIDLNQAIKFCMVHHFPDETNLLCLSNYQKTELTNQYWLKPSSSLVKFKSKFAQSKETEMVILKSEQKKFEEALKTKLYGERLYPTESVKYLGVKIETNLSWQKSCHFSF